MDRRFEGTGVALATPFTRAMDIDYEALERLVDHVTNGGVDYLVVMGTTAESPTLSLAEKKQVLHHVKANNKKGLPIVYGAGANDTKELLDYFEDDLFGEIDAILSVTPYYNKPSQLGLEKHYEQLADACPVPIILYNVPGRTSCNLEAKTTLSLAEHKNIIGIKEASGDLNQIGHILKAKPETFMVISGDDMMTLPMIAMGAIGVISVMANALPYQFSQMVEKCLQGDFAAARKLHLSLLPVGDVLSNEGNPAGLKCVLKQLEICEEFLRLPLMPVSDALRRETSQLLEAYK